MTDQVQTPEQPRPRLFRYGEDHAWDDPGPEFSNDDVRRHLTAFFPELANATIDVAALPDDQGRQVVTFKKNAGQKGAAGQDELLDLFAEFLVPILEQESGMAWGHRSARRIVRWALGASNLQLAPAGAEMLCTVPEGVPADA